MNRPPIQPDNPHAVAVLKRLAERDLITPFARLAESNHVTVFELASDTRMKHVIRVKHVFAWALATELGWSQPAIGNLLGLDHTSVKSAIDGVKALVPAPTFRFRPDASIVVAAPANTDQLELPMPVEPSMRHEVH